MRVVIVGAGLAGLSAAELLIGGGHEVTVLEASSRVGGRTDSRTDCFVDGAVAEAGAEWIDTPHRRIHALVQRFGLQLDPNVTTWTAVRRWLYRGGVLLGPAELHTIDPALSDDLDRFEQYLADVADGIADSSRPELHPDADRHDAMSVADVIDELHLGDLGRLFATRNMQGEFAAEPAEVSVLFIAQQRKMYIEHEARHGHVEAQRLLGGVSGLTAGLAAALPAGVVHLDEPVRSIALGDEGVRVTTSAADHAGDAVVLACSLIAARSIEFDPPLAPVLAAAIAGLGYGTVTKTALQYPARTWPPGYATTEGPAQRVYEPTDGRPGPTGILMAYTGADAGRALAALPEDERMDRVEHEQRDMYPGLDPRIGGFSRAWSTDPLFGGSYAVYRPGEIRAYWAALRRPWGRLHIAGEHAATCTGYLEGAVESGEAVAARLMSTD